MRPFDGSDAVLLLFFAFTMVVISLLLLLQAYLVCFLKGEAQRGRLPSSGPPLPARGATVEAPAAAAGAGDVIDRGEDAPASCGWVGDEEAGDCVVCLSGLGEDGSGAVRVLPRCRHAFHAGCIGRWLVSHSVCCPICRTPTRPPAAPVAVAVISTSPSLPPVMAAGVRMEGEAAGVWSSDMGGNLAQRGAVLLGEHQMGEGLNLPLLLLY